MDGLLARPGGKLVNRLGHAGDEGYWSGVMAGIQIFAAPVAIGLLCSLTWREYMGLFWTVWLVLGVAMIGFWLYGRLRVARARRALLEG